MNTEALKRRIELEITEEWWKVATLEDFQQAGIDLSKRGLKDDEIINLLSNLFHATAREYGN